MLLRDRRIQAFAALIVVTAAIWASVLFACPKTLNVAFLDVGEGLCGVVQTPSGKTLVIDCGTSSWGKDGSLGEKLVAPYLQSIGADKIDVAILSHPHSDHISGYPSLLKLKPADIVLDIGAEHASPIYRQFLNAVKESGAKYRIAKRGQSIDMGDGVVVYVLNPDNSHNYDNLNERSIAVRIVYKKTSFLFSADTGTYAEKLMVESGMELHSQVLQVGHHGSSESTSHEWLEAVKPQIAVISCGRRNQYNHPSIDTLRRIANAGVRIYRTDKHGAISFATDGNDIRIHTQQ